MLRNRSKVDTPAKAGVQKGVISLDSRFRGNDEKGSVIFYEFVKGSRLFFLPNPQPFNP
jgi:hypothetical protein